jgi:hypothetical protein
MQQLASETQELKFTAKTMKVLQEFAANDKCLTAWSENDSCHPVTVIICTGIVRANQ